MTGLLSSQQVQVLGPVQINSGWNVLGRRPGPLRGALPSDHQIRTGAAGPVNQSERRTARPHAVLG